MGLHVPNTPPQGVIDGGDWPGVRIKAKMVRGEERGKREVSEHKNNLRVPQEKSGSPPHSKSWLHTQERLPGEWRVALLSANLIPAPFCSPSPQPLLLLSTTILGLFCSVFSLELPVAFPHLGRCLFSPAPCFQGKRTPQSG